MLLIKTTGGQSGHNGWLQNPIPTMYWISFSDEYIYTHIINKLTSFDLKWIVGSYLGESWLQN